MAGVPAGRLSIEIVAEIARLQQDLDKAKRAVNAASKDMAQSAKHANDNLAGMASGIGKAGTQSKLASHHVANLGFQIQDMVVGLQGGQKPLTVFLQQGGQIGQIMGQAGIGVGGLAKAIGGMAGRFAVAHPLLVATTVAAGGAAVAMGEFTKQVNAEKSAELQAYAVSLGMTAEEIEKAGGAAVTSGDMLLGLWDVFKEFTGVEAIFSDVQGWIVDKIMAAAQSAKKNLSEIYAAAAATVDGIKHVWSNLGPILGNAVIAGANAAIGALEWLVNKALAGIRQITLAVNPLLKAADMVGLVPAAPTVSFGRINNPYAGAGAAAADAFTGAYKKRLGEANNAFDRFMGDWADAGAARAKSRLSKAAEDAGKEAGKKGGKAAGKEMADKWLEELTKDLAQSMAGFSKELDKIVDGIMKLSDADLDKALADAARKGELQFEKLNDEIQQTLEQVDALISSLGNMRGLGGLFGDIGNVLTSKNPIASMLGMGGVGTILGSVLGGQDMTDKMGTAFTKSIRETFPGLNEELAGKIGSTFAELTSGAAIGGAVGSTFFGSQAGQTGAMVGGMLGKAAFKEFASEGLKKALGAFGGPLGSILGSVVGGLLGNVMSGTKRGGATIGAGGVTGTWGNSDQRIGAATGIGNSAVDALRQLASALGVPLGSFSSSVSVRKNDLRFDPTGSGISKTSKGAVSFGQDEQALLAAIIKDAISDGAFEGLSEGFKKYLTSGDVESRLQDVLNLKGVMNEAAQMRDPQGFALGELDKWRTSMLAIATATGEGMADIEYVYGERRKEILEVANDNALDIERDRKALLIQIAELEGRSTEALAMARALETAEVDASLLPLYERIYQLQDEAAAAAIAKQAADLAEQAERDLAAARQAAAQAARSVYEKQVSIEAQIMTLQGNAAGALRVQRELELYAAEATIRPLLLHKYALEDQAAAAAIAQAEADKLADALRKAAEEAAALQKAIDDEIAGLNRRWLETIGDTAALRELDLGALLSDEARAIQQRIWDYTDALEAQKAAEEAAAKAAEDYNNRLAEARNALSQAYEREAGAIQQTIDKFRDFMFTIRDFRLGLQAANDNTVAGSRSRFLDTARMAQGGDANAVGGFSNSANAFLGTALNSARTRNEYQDQVAFVVRTALGVERSLGGQADSSQRQLDLLAEQVSQFIDLNENVLTFEQAIKNLQAIEAEQLPVVANTVSAGLDNVAAKIETATAKAENAEVMSRTALEAILKAAQGTERQLARIRVEGGAVTVRTDSDTPIQTEAA